MLKLGQQKPNADASFENSPSREFANFESSDNPPNAPGIGSIEHF